MLAVYASRTRQAQGGGTCNEVTQCCDSLKGICETQTEVLTVFFLRPLLLSAHKFLGSVLCYRLFVWDMESCHRGP